jgi:molecular chaperone DnaK
LAEAKTAIEGGDTDTINAKTQALTQAAMKLGQAMYEQQQAESAASAGGGSDSTAEAAPADEDVVDAEFSEVDDDKKA